MAPFSNLPEELMSLILVNLAEDKRALLAISQVSKKLHQISVPLLYAKVAIYPGTLACELLLRTFSQHPNLALCVHSIRTGWVKDDENFFLAFDQVLRQLSQLRRLEIHAHYCRPSATPYRALFLWTQRPPPLEQVIINYEGLRSVDACAFLHLPSLRSFEAFRFCDPQPIGSEWPRLDLTSVHPLAIDFEHSNSKPDVLEKLLSGRPNIVELRCGIPCTGNSDREFWPSAYMSAPLSPRAFSQALTPVWNSLRKLKITAWRQEWEGHDGTRLSCRQFRELAEVDVPARCFFHDSAPTLARAGVYKLLPPSIISLRVAFEPDMGFLRDPATVKRDTKVETLHSSERSSYVWLEEIMTCTGTILCELKYVEICERRAKEHMTLAWNIPHDLEYICLNSDIVLQASIRMWRPPPPDSSPEPE